MTTHLCTECGKSSTEEVLLLIHQTRIHDKTSYSCDECGADVIGKVSLSNHKRRHKIPAVKNLRKHKCEKCPYESEVKSNVNRAGCVWKGYVKRNRRLSWITGCCSSIENLPCQECNKTFPSRRNLIRHRIRVHMQEQQNSDENSISYIPAQQVDLQGLMSLSTFDLEGAVVNPLELDPLTTSWGKAAFFSWLIVITTC